MKSARNSLPTEPVNGVTCGIDWARDDHAVSIVDHHGREIMRCTIDHDAAGLRELLAVLERIGAREVAIERPDGPVVDTLLGAGVMVVVISPNQVKNLRGRYGSAGNKDDRFDAFVLADTLRTDRARLHPLLPDSRGHRHPAPDLSRPQRPRRPPRRRDQPAARAPERRVPRRGRIVRRPRLADQPGVPDPLRLPRPRRLALGQTPGRLAGQRRLQRPHRPFGALPPPHQRTARHPRNRRHRHHRRLRGRAVQPCHPDQGARHRDRRPTRPPRRRAHLHLAAPLGHRARGPSAQRDRRLPQPVSPPPNRWPAWPESRPPPANPAKSNTSDSAGPQTNNSATPSPTSPATAGAPTPGLLTCTTVPSPADTTTPTPSESSPAPGSTSSGTAGKTKSPTTPPNIAPSKHCSTKTNTGRLDTGQLMRCVPREHTRTFCGSSGCRPVGPPSAVRSALVCALMLALLHYDYAPGDSHRCRLVSRVDCPAERVYSPLG